MRKLFRVLAPVVVVGLVIAGAYAWREPLTGWGRATWARLTAPAPAATETGLLIASGVVEAQDLDVAAPVSGRIISLQASDGEAVEAGQPIAQLDTSLLDAQIEAATAAVQVAQAQVAQLRSGPRDADLAVARAAVRQAEAGAAAAHTAADDARRLVGAPSALDVEIARAETALQVAAEQAAAAEAAAAAADLEQQLWGRIVQRLGEGFDVELPPQLGGGSRHVDAPPDKLAEARLQWNLASQAAWEAHARQAAATAARNAAAQALADLRGEKADPVMLEGQAQAAEAAAPVADAAVAAANASLKLLEAGASAEQIAVAEAAVRRAEAARQVLEAKRTQYTVLAPRGGVLTEVVLHEGEVAVAGAPVARLGEAGDATLAVYVPASRMAGVGVGNPIAVAVDAYPGRTFGGTVTFIAGEAEFTPKNVQTREERASTVFEVKISVPNGDGAIKPGMPADAFFCPGSTACEFPFAAASEDQGSPASEFLARIIPQSTPGTITPAPAVRPSYAGSLEATQVQVASEVGGRAVAVAAAEGDRVTAGQVLVTIEGEELAAQDAEAEASVAAARAELARIQARAQPEQVAQAEVGVKQAEAAHTAAEARLAAARAARDRPQDLDRQINNARQQINTAIASVDSARAQLKSAQVLQESLPNPGSDEDKTRRAVYDVQVTAAEAQVRAAEAQQKGAQAVLARLSAIRSNPVEMDAAVRKAEREVDIARAGIDAAKTALVRVTAEPRPEAVALGRAQVAQAQASRLAIAAALDKLQVLSPTGGQVTMQAIHTGEVVTPATPLFTVADLGRLRLVVYVPVTEIGAVSVGDDAVLAVDAFPGRAFPATVTRIAEKAEYTPRNVQTADERARMVIAVELTLENPDSSLRPGMGAEASW